MARCGVVAIRARFSRLTDPRMERTKRHGLLDMVVIALCAAICGANSWADVERFGKAKRDWLLRFLDLPNGIPSHDTFGRVDINQVIPDPDQPRTEFSEEAIDRLAASIGEKGQLAAIRVRWSEDASKWIIISGERRWRAAKRADLPTIDCYFHDGALSRSEILEEQLIENLLREDLEPIEEARSFQHLMQLNSWTARKLAESLHIPSSKVSRSLALLSLPGDVQGQVATREISARAGYEISRLGDEAAQRRLAERVAQNQLTHDQAAKIARQQRGKGKISRQATRLTFGTETGFKVTVAARRRRTYHEIEAALEDVLEEVRIRIANNVQLF